MRLLEGKRILFFSVKTFGLENVIKNQLIEMGAEVDYYDERPKDNNFTKAIIRLKRNFYEHKITNYYNSILEEIRDRSYDFLFVNRGEVIPVFFLEQFMDIFPKTIKIFHTWDSFTNHGHPINIIKYFDKKFSFDHEDCEKYGLQLRPLFYTKEFPKIKAADNKLKYDLLFLGTAHSDRYVLTKKIVQWCNQNSFKAYTFFYIQGLSVFLYRKIFEKNFRSLKLRDMNFKGLSSNQILDLYKISNVVLDINHVGQKGLTMRTFESLGARRKMITTNKEVKKYSFYNANNIQIIDRKNFELDKTFFDTPYENIDESLYKTLSLEGWVTTIFSDNYSNIWT